MCEAVETAAALAPSATKAPAPLKPKVRKHRGLYALLTDGSRGLFLDTSSGLTIPNHTHWPIARKPKKTGWALALLDHVVYGLLGTNIKSKRQSRPFGLQKHVNFYSIQVDSHTLDSLFEQQKAVWRWHHYHGAYDGPFKLKVESLETSLDKFDLNSAHCVRSLKNVEAKNNSETQENACQC